MAEVHIIGQIVSASDFPQKSISCRWKLNFGPDWKAVEGLTSGLTQLDTPQLGEICYLCHPIDVHLVTSSLDGWPRFQLEVWQCDFYGRYSPVGYGCLIVPSTPGKHRIECETWKPIGSLSDKLYSLFTGGGLRLTSLDITSDPSERCRITTETSGKITFDLYIITRNFDRYGIETN